MAEVLLFTTHKVRRRGSTPSPTICAEPDTRFTHRTCSTAEPSKHRCGMAYAEEIGFPGEVIERGVRAARASRRSLSTPVSRSGCCRRRSWRRPAPEPAARCCSTHACRCRRSGPRGRRVCRSRSTAWTRTRSCGRGRHRCRPRTRRIGRGRRAVSVPRRPALFRRLQLPSYRAGAAALLRKRVLEFLATR